MFYFLNVVALAESVLVSNQGLITSGHRLRSWENGGHLASIFIEKKITIAQYFLTLEI